MIGDRPFVNNASFGAYAAVVQSPAYRDDKAGTTLRPAARPAHRPARAAADRAGRRHRHIGTAGDPGQQQPLRRRDLAGLGPPPPLDRGVLGVFAVTVRQRRAGGRPAARRGRTALALLDRREAVVDADAPEVPVGVDGEALTLPDAGALPDPARALRVRVPRHRPGVRAPGPG